VTKPDILPEGESLRRAVRWISDRFRDDPKAGFGKLINEAAIRFDLSPLEVEFLMNNWGKPGKLPPD
jgi:hypothetical protein